MRTPLLPVGLLLASLLHAQKPPPGTVVGEPLGRRLDAIVRERAPALWGAVLVAVDGVPVLAKGYGWADRQKVPIGPQSLFDLGGASQLLTTMVVLRMVADRKWRLDDPVGKHLPDWPADRAAITLDQLIRHTSGLPADAAFGGGAGGALRTAIQAIGKAPLVDKPGAAFHYSSLNAVVLAALVETVAAQRFEKVLTDRVCKPFGMDGAGACNGRFDSKLVTLRRSRENERGEPATAFVWNWPHRGARGVLASVLDVHELLTGLAEAKLLDRDQLAALWRPLAGGDQLQVSKPVTGSDGLLRIAAGAAGYRVRWLVHEASRSWVVVLSDDLTASDALETALVAELALHRVAAAAAVKPATAAPAVPALPVPAPATGAAGIAGERARFVGTFVLPQGGGRFRIEAAAEGLVLRGEGLQAASRLLEGRWPPAQQAAFSHSEDRGVAVIERLLRGDATVVGEAFANEDVAAQVSASLGEWLQKDGPLQRVELVGTRAVERTLHSWFRLQGQRGTQVFHAVWADGERFQSLVATSEEGPFHLAITVVRADCAVGKTPAGTELRLTMEGVVGRRVLVFEDGSVGPVGLLDCPEAVAAPR